MLLLLTACGWAPDAPPTEVPYHGGCTFEDVTGAATGVGVSDRALYSFDDEERIVAGVVVVSGQETQVAITYDDAGCQTSYWLLDPDDAESPGLGWDQTCDEHLNPVHVEGQAQTGPYTKDHTWTYDADGNTEAEVEVDTTDTAVVERDRAYTWSDDRLISVETTVDGVPSTREEWGYDGELLVLALEEDLQLGTVDEERWGYDAWGRELWNRREDADGTLVESARVWSPVQYHELVVGESSNGAPGALTAWDCSEEFPWSCEGQETVLSVEGRRERHAATQTWLCDG